MVDPKTSLLGSLTLFSGLLGISLELGMPRLLSPEAADVDGIGGGGGQAMPRQGRCQADTQKLVRGWFEDRSVYLNPMLAMVCD